MRGINRPLMTGSALILTLSLVAVSPTKSEVTIQLVPDSGPPGTYVTLHGYVPSAINRKTQNYGPVSFGGWPNGLSMLPNTVTWSNIHPGHFTTHFRVPTVSWLSPRGTAPLTTGTYHVGIQCFGLGIPGCGGDPYQASASFRLTGAIPHPDPVPTLIVRPKAASPGAMVTISGWAPLTSESAGVPNGYGLVWHSARSTTLVPVGTVKQRANGDLYGTVQVPVSASNIRLQGKGYLRLQSSSPMTSTKSFDSTAFDVTSPRVWTDILSGQTVSNLASNQNRGYAVPLTTRGKRIYTAAGSHLWTSDNSGHSWTRVATGSLESALQAKGYVPFWQSNLVGLTLAPGSTKQLFASIPTEQLKEGAPPIIDLGLFSPNGGQTWKFAPRPTGMRLQDFGGFQIEGAAIWAWWQSRAGQIQVEATRDGGRHWHVTLPSAAESKGHLFLGPVPADNYGQFGTESVVASSDHGWLKVGTMPLDGSINQLAILSDGVTLLLGNAQYPIQETSDEGKVWRYIATPGIPGSTTTGYPSTKRLLPNGVLLAANPNSGVYYVLHPGSTRWIRVPTSDAPPKASILGVAGNTVYWTSLNAYDSARPSFIVTVPVSRY